MVPTLVPVSPFVLSAPSTGHSVQLREVGTLTSRTAKADRSIGCNWFERSQVGTSSCMPILHQMLASDPFVEKYRLKAMIQNYRTPFSISRSIPAAGAARWRPHFCCRLLRVRSLVLGLHCRARRSTSAFSVLREKKSERNLLLIITDAIINN
jgi:hypothetical protein